MQSQGFSNQIDSIRAVRHHFQGKTEERKSIAREKLGRVERRDGYLTGQSDGGQLAERHATLARLYVITKGRQFW